MTTLSVVVITLNEEANIRACLESASFADEIVVVDSGSVDRTVEICREFTDKVFFRAWDGYPTQRNAAHGLASGDWILSLDADERVSPELAGEILAAVGRPDQKLDGFYLPYQVFWKDKWLRHGGFYPERHLRLFRRGKAEYGARAVHEAIRASGPTGRLRNHILHYTYSSIGDYLARMDRYSRLSAEEYARQGRETGPVRMTGRALFTFFGMFVLKRGFLDGWEGFLTASLYGVYTFVKYARLYELTREARKK
ncbi:MAG: glycosyltransferase family 2 protein [Pseudomonadota bacterium]